jgi:hypothetical protein
MFKFRKKKQEINLLPESEVPQVISKTPLVFSGIIVLIMILAIGTNFAFGFLQKREIDQMKNDIVKIEAEGKGEVFETAKLFAKTKKILVDYQNFVKSYPDLSQKVFALERVVPVSVQLAQLSIDNAGKASLDGQAANPDVINDFLGALQKDTTNFKDITVTSVSKEQGRYKFAVNFYFK